jgi:hypothetical protein
VYERRTRHSQVEEQPEAPSPFAGPEQPVIPLLGRVRPATGATANGAADRLQDERGR